MQLSSIKETEVAIIGAGYAGLAAAALLAQKGVRTEVFELLKTAGGRARTTERDGFVMDHGIHVHRPADDSTADKLIRMLGETIEWAPAHGDRPVTYCDGEKFIFPQSAGEALKLEFLKPIDRLRILILLARIKYGDPNRHMGISFADYAGRGAKSPKFRTLLKSLSIAAMAPDIETTSAGELTDVLKRCLRAERKIGSPVGGEGQLVRKMIKHIVDPGRLNLGVGVKRIHIKDRKVEAVETENGLWKPKVVLFAIPIQRLFRFADPEHFRPEFRKYAKSLVPTAGISVDLALDGEVAGDKGGIFDLSGPFIGKFPSVADPSLAPPGKQLATWLWLVDRDMLRDKKFMRGAKAAMRQEIEKMMPGIMKAVLWERWLFFGILDGVLLRVGQSWHDRHPQQSEDVPNLFFAGDTAKAPGVSGDIAFESAIRVVPLIQKYLEERRS